MVTEFGTSELTKLEPGYTIRRVMWYSSSSRVPLQVANVSLFKNKNFAHRKVACWGNDMLASSSP